MQKNMVEIRSGNNNDLSVILSHKIINGPNYIGPDIAYGVKLHRTQCVL